MPALLSAVLAAPAADVVGTWPKGPIKLPGAKLPNVPLLGNGFLGVAFGSPIGGTSKTSSSAIGPNGSGALDMWLNTNVPRSAKRKAYACTLLDRLGTLHELTTVYW